MPVITKRALLDSSLLAALAVTTALAVYVRPAAESTPPGPIQHEIYIWQRHWDASLLAAIAQAAPRVSAFTVLSAEVSWQGARPGVVRVPVDWQALHAAGRPVGIALRIGAFRGDFRKEAPPAQFLTGLASTLVAEARAAGVEPTELQVDFDCAESKLDGYLRWVEALRASVKPVPLTITALPCWLKHSEFTTLARASDGFVLQAHSLARPSDPDAKLSLCDPAQVQRWVSDAGRMVVPFRVALPTYGYLVAFTDEGRFVGISADGPMPAWPVDAEVRAVRADAPALARLVQSWQGNRPATLRGVAWYRLPVEGDRLNWSWKTLSTVMSGRIPRETLGVEVAYPEPGLAEITLVNSGEADVKAARNVRIEWKEPRLVAADGLRGFSVAEKNPLNACLSSERLGASRPLAPGERWKIGWLRFKSETEVTAHVASADE